MTTIPQTPKVDALTSYRIAYHVDKAPTAWTRAMAGKLYLNDERFSIQGRVSLDFPLSTIKSIGSHQPHYGGTWGIVVHGPRTVYFSSRVALLFFGFLNISNEPSNNRIYTHLHKQFGGPGLCARCKFDLRVSRLPCPDCGHDQAIPMPTREPV